MLPAVCINYPLISPERSEYTYFNEDRALWEGEYIWIYFKHVLAVENFYGKSLRQDNEHVRPDCSEFLHITTKSQLWSEQWSLGTRGALLTSANAGLQSNYSSHQPWGLGTSRGMRNGETLVRRELASVVIKSRMWWMEWHSRPGIVTHSWAEN